jgi:hypothetical protein
MALLEGIHPINKDGSGLRPSDSKFLVNILACTKHIGDSALTKIIKINEMNILNNRRAWNGGSGIHKRGVEQIFIKSQEPS